MYNEDFTKWVNENINQLAQEEADVCLESKKDRDFYVVIIIEKWEKGAVEEGMMEYWKETYQNALDAQEANNQYKYE